MSVAELKTFALMVGAICGWEFVKWLERRAKALRPSSASPPVEAVSPAGGRKLDDRLWEFDCGCIEAVRPYRWYPCHAHRRGRATIDDLFIPVKPGDDPSGF